MSITGDRFNSIDTELPEVLVAPEAFFKVPGPLDELFFNQGFNFEKTCINFENILFGQKLVLYKQ